jgi:hypothetical protein
MENPILNYPLRLELSCSASRLLQLKKKKDKLSNIAMILNQPNKKYKWQLITFRVTFQIETLEQSLILYTKK